MSTKQYLKGTARKKNFDTGGYVINFSVNAEQIAEIAKAQGNKGWVNLSMTKRKEDDPYGNDHYIYVNDFVPEKQGGKSSGKKKKSVDEEDDLPF